MLLAMLLHFRIYQDAVHNTKIFKKYNRVISQKKTKKNIGIAFSDETFTRLGKCIKKESILILLTSTFLSLTFEPFLCLLGPPDAPLDVQLEQGPSPGIAQISWLPVTIDAAGTSNGVRVTGYTIYADKKKVNDQFA